MQHTLEWLPAEGPPAQLLLLLHGWGGNGAEMASLAQALRGAFPQAAVLAPDAPLPHEPTDGSPGAATARQWYAAAGLTPENWPQRVDDALPGLHDWVRVQQQRLGVAPEATALGGFSQGAVLALALAMQHDGIAGRVLAFGGCLTRPPEAAPRLTTLHLFHGADDEVIPAEGSRQALDHLAQLDGDATLDIAKGVGCVLHPALIDCALHRLRSHIPQRTWRVAMGAAAASSAAADDED